MVWQVVSKPSYRFKSLESHCEGGIVRDFTICSNTNGLVLWSNVIKDLCSLILHQLVVGWIGKAYGSTSTFSQFKFWALTLTNFYYKWKIFLNLYLKSDNDKLFFFFRNWKLKFVLKHKSYLDPQTKITARLILL